MKDIGLEKTLIEDEEFSMEQIEVVKKHSPNNPGYDLRLVETKERIDKTKKLLIKSRKK